MAPIAFYCIIFQRKQKCFVDSESFELIIKERLGEPLVLFFKNQNCY